MVKMLQNVFVCALWDGKPVGLQNYTSSTGMAFFIDVYNFYASLVVE